MSSFRLKKRETVDATIILIENGENHYSINFGDGHGCTMVASCFHSLYESVPPAHEITAEWMEGIRSFAETIHSVSVDKGWWETPREPGTLLMLVVSELSEALEEHRKGVQPTAVYYRGDGKPEGFGIELADAIVRLLDMAEGLNIDIAECLRLKSAYNYLRPNRHGGKVC